MKYTWDLNNLNYNLQNTYYNDNSNYNDCLSLYNSAVNSFIYRIEENTKGYYFNDGTLIKIAHYESNIIDALNVEDMPLFKKLLKQPTIRLKPHNNEINHNFDEQEVLDVVRSFLYDITYEFGYHFDELIYDNRVALNKSNSNLGRLLTDTFNDYFAIGVNGINKESMMSILVHEYGHAYPKINNYFNRTETLPILLELYLNRYIKKEYPNLNMLPIIQNRFITCRNRELDTIKTLYKVRNTNNVRDKIMKLRALNSRCEHIFSFNNSLEYLTSTEKAVDIESKTKYRYTEIRNLLEQEKKNRNVRDLVYYSNNDTIATPKNNNKIKKLMRK